MREPKREDYQTDAEFLDAACAYYGVPTWMTKELPKEVYEHAARAWEEIRKSKGNVITAEPKRFEMIVDEFYDGDMAEDPNGNYVLMQDYSFLRKEAQSLKEEVDRLKSILKQTDRLLLTDGEFEAYADKADRCVDLQQAVISEQSKEIKYLRQRNDDLNDAIIKGHAINPDAEIHE